MSQFRAPDISAYGDHAVLVKYDVDGFSAKVSDALQSLAVSLRAQDIWCEIVPAYDSLVVVFDGATITPKEAINRVEGQIARNAKSEKPKAGKLVEIPVYYGGNDGPDMATICKSSGLSETEVIKLHSAKPYNVCMMGFVPGFTFLSAAPIALHHPRQTTPRAKVAAGSVGIANWQTGIYGLESPGGWQIIGRTPLSIFDKLRKDPFLVQAGDRIQFVPTTPHESGKS
ncbi:5-oxoprolinase subunit PxpB [Litorimonas sp. RW-G-Af-16]|uniref:5-oxoprolinase subunit PxpB n=1 Tax=Litorimonas sp. RW-G-Af-16 TaxID=3241168 RepID=UPI00390C5139